MTPRRTLHTVADCPECNATGTVWSWVAARNVLCPVCDGIGRTPVAVPVVRLVTVYGVRVGA